MESQLFCGPVWRVISQGADVGAKSNVRNQIMLTVIITVVTMMMVMTMVVVMMMMMMMMMIERLHV